MTVLARIATRPPFLLVLALAWVASSSRALGQCEMAILTDSDPTGFGLSVALSGDVLLVGAPTDDEAGGVAGAAHVFRLEESAWLQEATLTASDWGVGDAFGSSVAMSGDLALIGADATDDDGTNSGSAYVFRFDGVSWLQEAKLTGSDADAENRFGSTVSINGDVAVIGAWQDNPKGDNIGSAYVFRYDGVSWAEEAQLVPSALRHPTLFPPV